MNYILLAWEPSIAQGSRSYSRRLLELGRTLRFVPKNVDPFKIWNLQAKPRTLPWFSHVSQSTKFVANWSRSYDTYKQTNRDYYFLHIDKVSILFRYFFYFSSFNFKFLNFLYLLYIHNPLFPLYPHNSSLLLPYPLLCPFSPPLSLFYASPLLCFPSLDESSGCILSIYV